MPLYYAGVAQLVEQLICNQQVAGSIPIASSNGIKELGSACRNRFFPCRSYVEVIPKNKSNIQPTMKYLTTNARSTNIATSKSFRPPALLINHYMQLKRF
jgi:hypothetical protein